ncbi:MAG: 30S ribosomal protein S21 [Gemmatimonadales bacterium]|nr:30S ribosomal protein S21 [Gemmatimonadales bacterium]NIN13247.1 30S ribosomal protein S21 [Gemmatimonadales bacterium]NIN51264.1 30S ribosomal protein S21 [Gemmatimonadales bacterium]NIP08728.1 30S ribosomal protein S21 [Gemmatimonadales bacterium]NIR00981.1 30S ribosomal protein S21 [Gemmatimonadales bacterium]
MTEIILDENDRLDWALKAFRRKVQRSGILQDLRNKRFYVKPSLAKRRKAAAAVRRRLRARGKRR